MKISIKLVFLITILFATILAGCLSEPLEKYMDKEFYNSNLYLFVHKLLVDHSAVTDENNGVISPKPVETFKSITNFWILADDVRLNSKVKWEGTVIVGFNKREAAYLHPRLEDYAYTKDLIQKTGIDHYLKLIMTGEIHKGIDQEALKRLLKEKVFFRNNNSEGVVYFVYPYGKPGGQPRVILYAIVKFENNRLEDMKIYGGAFK